MKIADMGKRRCDNQGCGHYGASRGNRKHSGVDLCKPDSSSLDDYTEVIGGFNGTISKVGYAYSDKPHRYVEIKLTDFYCRIFYIEPCVSVGDKVSRETVIGHSMPLGEYYEGITEHVHVEFFELKEPSKGVTKSNRLYVDPKLALEVLK